MTCDCRHDVIAMVVVGSVVHGSPLLDLVVVDVGGTSVAVASSC